MNYIQRSWCFRISPTQFQCVEPMQFNYIHPTEFRTETELEGNGSWPGWDSYRGQPGALVSQANSLTTPPSAQLCDTAAQNKKCLHYIIELNLNALVQRICVCVYTNWIDLHSSNSVTQLTQFKCVGATHFYPIYQNVYIFRKQNQLHLRYPD